jgi:uncharacterized membrane protein
MSTSPHSTLTENIAIAVATLVLGLMAGFFWTYTFNVNLALLQTDGKTYATVQSLLNQYVRHTAFFVLFFGGGLVPVLALAINFKHYQTPVFWLLAGAAAAYIFGVIFFTREVNLPLNAYTESWNVTNLPLNWMATREEWNRANAMRVAWSCAAFVLCLIAMVLRTSPQNQKITAQ